MRNEYLLRDLANGGFLPGYGFPTHVVSLNNVTMRELSKTTQESREDSFGKMKGGPSRDLAVAVLILAAGATGAGRVARPLAPGRWVANRHGMNANVPLRRNASGLDWRHLAFGVVTIG